MLKSRDSRSSSTSTLIGKYFFGTTKLAVLLILPITINLGCWGECLYVLSQGFWGVFWWLVLGLVPLKNLGVPFWGAGFGVNQSLGWFPRKNFWLVYAVLGT